MRQANFVGVTADGEAMLVRLGDEHVTIPIDERLRAALATPGMQLALSPEGAVSPREAQRRIRCGESAAEIAAAAGVPVETIARFEGPVLDERRWQAERARRAQVAGVSLDERFASATGFEESVEWDAWVDPEDGDWRVRALAPDGRVAVWTWNTATSRLRGVDDLARLSLTGRVVEDDIEAVLRPIATARAAAPAAPAAPAPPVERLQPEAQEEEETPELVEGEVVEPKPAKAPAQSARKQRPTIPAWDDILFGSRREE